VVVVRANKASTAVLPASLDRLNFSS